MAEDFAGGSIYVDIVDLPIHEATSRFSAVKGLLAGEPTTSDLNGHPTKTFSAQTKTDRVGLEDAFGIGIDCCAASGDEIFVDLGSKTMLIRTGVYGDSSAAEVSDTLESLHFAS